MVNRITPEELEALGAVMRKLGVYDLATTDTRIIMSPHAPVLTSQGVNIDPMRPIAETHSPLDAAKLADEDEDLLFAAVT